MIEKWSGIREAITRAHDWVASLRRENMSADVSGQIEARLSLTDDPIERAELLFLLSGELFRHSKDREAEAVAQRYVEEFPQNVRAWINSAELRSMSGYRSELAAPAIEQAIALAKESGEFLRECYGVKARIALAMKDNALLNEAIRQMIELGPRKDLVDIGVESDFVERAPDGSIEPDVMEGFRKLYLEYYGRPFAG